MGTRVVNEQQATDRSPSGLPIRHLTSGAAGATDLYAGEQWLQPGEAVVPHTHDVEEILLFVAGEGEARIGEASILVGAGVTVHIPAGETHGFRNTGQAELRLFVIFPGNAFAATDIVEG